MIIFLWKLEFGHSKEVEISVVIEAKIGRLGSGVVSLTAVCWPVGVHMDWLAFICLKLWLLHTALSCTMSYPKREGKGWNRYLEEEERAKKTKEQTAIKKTKQQTTKKTWTATNPKASQSVFQRTIFFPSPLNCLLFCLFCGRIQFML